MAITIPESQASVSYETRRNHEKYERLLWWTRHDPDC
jgi:hypothetical protein